MAARSILGKRSYGEIVSDQGMYDEVRYNQPIGENFFEKGVGHNLIVHRRERDSVDKYDAGEMQQWWENILYSKMVSNK
jgi:hypothetical protein